MTSKRSKVRRYALARAHSRIVSSSPHAVSAAAASSLAPASPLGPARAVAGTAPKARQRTQRPHPAAASSIMQVRCALANSCLPCLSVYSVPPSSDAALKNDLKIIQAPPAADVCSASYCLDPDLLPAPILFSIDPSVVSTVGGIVVTVFASNLLAITSTDISVSLKSPRSNFPIAASVLSFDAAASMLTFVAPDSMPSLFLIPKTLCFRSLSMFSGRLSRLA